MASLGELFIELGVVGDVKPLEKALETQKEAIRQIEKEISASKRLEQYKKDLAAATTQNEKKVIKENFAKEIQKEKLVEETKGTEKLIAGKKALAGRIAGVVKGIGVFIGAVTAAAIAMNKLTNELVQSNQAMLNLTRTTDIAQSTFQKWGGIGKMLGVENADQQLAGLNQRLFELMLTGEGARGFQLAGINPIGQDAEGVLEQLRNRIRGLSDTSASYLLQQMGLDPQMLHLLRMSREEFEALGETIRKYQLTPEQSQQIQQMNMQLQIASIKMKYFKDKAVLALMPYWVRLVESFATITEFLIKAGEWINKNVKGWLMLAGGITVANGKINSFSKFIKGISTVFSGIITKIPMLGKAATFLGKGLAKAFLPLTAAYLLLDDIATYFTGGDSLIGRVIDWSKQTGAGFTDAFSQMFGGDFIGGFNALMEQLLDVCNDILSVTARLLEIALDFLTFGAYSAFKNSKVRKILFPTPEEVLDNIQKWNGQSTGGAAGVAGVLPDLSPQAVSNVNNYNNSKKTDNSNNSKQINQYNTVYTQQAEVDTGRMLRQAQYAFSW